MVPSVFRLLLDRVRRVVDYPDYVGHRWEKGGSVDDIRQVFTMFYFEDVFTNPRLRLRLLKDCEPGTNVSLKENSLV